MYVPVYVYFKLDDYNFWRKAKKSLLYVKISPMTKNGSKNKIKFLNRSVLSRSFQR